MPSNSDSACPELLARIRQLEEETARLQRLIAELVLKNQHLRRDIRAAGVWRCTWTETEDDHTGMLRSDEASWPPMGRDDRR
jgi:hypothetical protein